MRIKGKYAGPGRTYDGTLTITFEVEDDEKAIESLKGYGDSELIIEAEKFYKKRSLDANGYFWILAQKMAMVLGSDKETVYFMQLRKYGVFMDSKVKPEAVEHLKRTFRLAELFDEIPDDEGFIKVRCYIGTSHYNQKEFGFLLDKTVEDCNDLGIETMTPEEIARIVKEWKG